MRQPPRQPPRQPARNTARRAAPKAAPKGGARGGKPAARGAPRQQTRQQQSANAGARAAQHARDAQRAQQQRGSGPSGPTKRSSAGGGPAGKRRPLRGWRSWWATHEMDRRNRGGRTGAGGRSVGILAARGWTVGRAVWIFLLLLLAAFTGSAALGAGSGGTAALAFLFLLGAIAVATSARAKAFFATYPARTSPVADFHIDDLKVDDEDVPGLDESELNSMEDLERSMRRARQAPSQPDDAPAPQTALQGGPATGDDVGDTATTAESAPAEAAEQAPAESAPAEAAPAESTRQAAGSTTDEAPPVVSVPAQREDGTVEEPAQREQAASRPLPTSLDDVEQQDASGTGSDPTPESTPLDDTAAELMEPLVDEEAATDTSDEPVGSPETSTQLKLLASESAGSDLLSAYTEETTLPPEAVRDVAATLIVSDLAASVMFYTELLGLVEIDRARDAVLLEAGFGRVLLWRREDAPPSGGPVMHLTFEVGDIDSAYRALSARGVKFTHPPRSALSGEVHDLRAASFLDPDGHGLAITELKQRTEPAVGQK